MLTKPNILRLVFFVAAFAAALYYPVNRVLSFERPKEKPVEMRFPVRAYDPYDPMRGHYLRMTLRNELPMTKEEYDKLKPAPARRTEAAAVLEAGEDGFARVVALRPMCDVPADRPFVKAQMFFRSGKNRTAVVLPFDRYYINEKLAADAEKLLQKITRDKKRSAVLVVNIYAGGRYAVKDLLVDGKPILQLLRPAK